MLTIENVVGKQEDWANYITNVEMRETPFLDWLPVGSAPVNPLFDYLADKYRTPRDNSHVDGEPWKVFNSALDKLGRLKSLIQWFDNTVSVSKLSQDVTHIGGINDILAREIPKCLKEMATDMEAAFCDDHDGREDNKTVGYRSRAVGSWIASGAQALHPVPADFRPPAASIKTNATSTTTEDMVRDVLASMWKQNKTKEPLTGFVGQALKRQFSNFVLMLPSSDTTQITGTTYQIGKDGTISRSISVYNSDFAPLYLVLSPWLVTLTGSAAAQDGRGYFLHKSKWELRWNQKPRVYRPEFKGGSYEAAMDAIDMLVCKNPLAEGKMIGS